MPRQAKNTQRSKEPPSKNDNAAKEEELSPIQPPVLLSDIELSEQSTICEMMENMSQQRKKILDLGDEKKWTFEKCEELFSFLKKKIFDTILRENIFISLDIADLFQTFCDYREKYLEFHQKKENHLISLYVTKMKYLAIQIIDEIVKELFHMEDIDDEDEDYDEDESQEKLISNDPAKQLYKQF